MDAAPKITCRHALIPNLRGRHTCGAEMRNLYRLREDWRGCNDVSRLNGKQLHVLRAIDSVAAPSGPADTLDACQPQLSVMARRGRKALIR